MNDELPSHIYNTMSRLQRLKYRRYGKLPMKLRHWKESNPYNEAVSEQQGNHPFLWIRGQSEVPALEKRSTEKILIDYLSKCEKESSKHKKTRRGKRGGRKTRKDSEVRLLLASAKINTEEMPKVSKHQYRNLIRYGRMPSMWIEKLNTEQIKKWNSLGGG